MSSTNIQSMSCDNCNKLYKSRGALNKHISKCSVPSENITSNITEIPIQNYEIAGLKEQLRDIINSAEPPPVTEPIKDENILVNTAALDSLMKAFVSELFSHQHKQIYAILEQNTKLVDVNKMLLSMVRTLVHNKQSSDNETEQDNI